LRERVTIEAPARVDDGAGGAALTWSEVATVQAEVAAGAGREVAAGERLEARQRLTVTIRHRADVTAAMRLVWRDEPFNIKAVRDPDGRRRWLQIHAEGGGV
jgi:SPP1 family predicted phage head-tail adaptor